MEKDKLKKILQKTGVLMEGHFELSSGRHAGRYLQCARVLQYPEYTKFLAKSIASMWKDEKIDTVIGPALGGVVLAYAVGAELQCRAIFSERKDKNMEIRRGFSINSGENILIVEDVVTTGGSVREVINLLQRKKANIIGISSLINRGKNINFKYSFKPLLNLNIKSYQPDNCPLCQKNIPFYKPGSQK
ncbi:MAG: orotate phosphoribosyltransferase [Bacillota bacterium]